MWAIITANFTADWGMYTILICLPKYFIEVLHFDLAKVRAMPNVTKTSTQGVLVSLTRVNFLSENFNACVFRNKKALKKLTEIATRCLGHNLGSADLFVYEGPRKVIKVGTEGVLMQLTYL